MPHLKVLIRKTLRAIDTRAPRPIPIQEIATLNHEILNHAVEYAVLVALRPASTVLGFACAKLAEVFCCSGYDVREKFHFDAAEWFAAECGVEEDDWVALCGHSDG